MLRNSLLLLGLSIVPVAVSHGATILSVTGPNDATTLPQSLFNSPAVGFSLNAAFTNVSISVPLMTYGGSGDWNLQAYLTTQLGPGTTAALHEVASRTETIPLTGAVSGPSWALTPLVVFSNLSLPAGQYYVLLGGSYATQNAWWAGSTAGNATVSSSNASLTDPQLLWGSVDLLYWPASSFSSFDGNLWVTIEGDPATTVPEPGTWMLACAGVLVLGWRARAQSRR